MRGVVGSFIRQALLELKIDDTVRFSKSNAGTIHSQMNELKQFGEAGKLYLFSSVTHYDKNELVVVRLA